MPDYPTTPSARDGKRQPKTPRGQGREAKARRQRDAKRRKAPEGLGRRSRLCSASPVPSARAQGPGNRAPPRQEPGHARMQARGKENAPSIRPTRRRLARRPPAGKGEDSQRHAEEGAAQGQSQPGGESANAAGLLGLTAPPQARRAYSASPRSRARRARRSARRSRAASPRASVMARRPARPPATLPPLRVPLAAAASPALVAPLDADVSRETSVPPLRAALPTPALPNPSRGMADACDVRTTLLVPVVRPRA